MVDDVIASYRLPNGEAEKLPLTIEITMSVAAWRRLQNSLQQRHPDYAVDRAVSQALARFEQMAGSQFDVDERGFEQEAVKERDDVV